MEPHWIQQHHYNAWKNMHIKTGIQKKLFVVCACLKLHGISYF